jgi:hypothetical protein
MSAKVTLLVVGLIVGGVIGWFTAPRPAVDINVGGVSLQVEGGTSGGTMMATEDDGGSMKVQVGGPSGFLSDPVQRTAIFAVIGGILGLGMGFLADRRQAGA